MINTKTINISNPIIAFFIFVLLDILKVILKVLLFIPVFAYLAFIKVLILSYICILKKLIRMHNYIYDKVIVIYGTHPKIRDIIIDDFRKMEV